MPPAPNSHAPRSAPRRSTRAPLALAALIALLVATPAASASAQLGGMIKRAVDKQLDKQVDKHTPPPAPGAPEAFTDVVLELTSDRLAQVLRGLAASRGILDGENGAPARATLVSRRDQLSRQLSDLRDANASAVEAHQQKERAHQECREQGFARIRERQDTEAQARIMDPAFQQKYVDLSTKMQLAQQRGDTTEMRRIQHQIQQLVHPTSRADSLAVDKQCGAPPQPPASLARLTALEADLQKTNAEIRTLEQRADDAEAQASGLTIRQFRVAKERISYYLMRAKSRSQQRGFNATELAALGARHAELERLF